jgi:trimeric autotransporter adhesin
MDNSISRLGPLLLAYLLCSCGGGSGGGGMPQPIVSSGPKIFATSATHSADFLHDTSLAGTTAIEKADSFCQTDANRPDSGTYKAILVDGVSRDALVPLDWVLKPNTTYYQVDNDVQIGTTTSDALFGQNLSADIHDSFGVSGGNNSNTSTVWTGFGDGVSFTTGPLTCNAWSYGGSDGTYAPYGISYGTDGTEWYTNGGQVCSLSSHLYCAEQ